MFEYNKYVMKKKKENKLKNKQINKKKPKKRKENWAYKN